MSRSVAGRGSITRRFRAVLAAVAMVLVAGVWFVVLRPQALGGSAVYVVVRGDSMLPTYQSGDLVVVQRAATYAIGDPVAYRVPDGELGAGLIVIHRIVGIAPDGGFVLRGDNNPAPDPWTPQPSDVVGRTWFAVGGFGAVIATLHRPVIAGALAAALVVGWLVARGPGPRTMSVRSGGADDDPQRRSHLGAPAPNR